MDSFVRRWTPICLVFLLLLFMIPALGAATPVAAAAQSAACATLFPEVTWEDLAMAGPVPVEAAGVPAAVATRFANDTDTAAAVVESVLGLDGSVLDGASVCLVSDAMSSELASLAVEYRQLHAAVLAEDGVVVVTVRQLPLVPSALAYGLAYVGLWELASRLGETGYPEPLGEAIAQWITATVTDRVDLNHAAMRVSNLFSLSANIDWTSGRQEPLVRFDPQYNESPIGDFAAFAASERGTEVFTDPGIVDWPAIEAEWRAGLREELVGTTKSTSGWIFGLGVVVGAVALAVIAAWLRRRSLRRMNRRRPSVSAQ